MRAIGVFEAKQQFSALVAEVEAGGEVVITRHGQPVARLVPQMARPPAAPTEAQIEAEIEDMRRFRSKVKPGPGWRELRDEGRRF